MAEAHRIDDLARPRLPWPIRLANGLGRPLARRLALDVDSLLALARRRTGLADFGDDWFREPLRVLVDALEHEARPTALGRLMARELLVQLLVTRLRLEELIARRPEILAEEIGAPVFIVGLPRTGTTHLHNLLSQDPALRSLPYWESLEPIPKDAGLAPAAVPDPRIARCERALRVQHYVMPLFERMHEMSAEAPHEEIQLLAATFSTMLFESVYPIPSYRDWYRATDQTPAYRYLRRLLQALQWLRGPRRWVLKSPQHLEQLGPLLATVPDARIALTHRDPVRVTASVCTMIAYGHRMQNDRIDLQALGRYWSSRVEDLLGAALRDRDRLPVGQVMDVRFHEFMADELGTVERVLAFAGHSPSAAARRAVADYLTGHRRGRHGTVAYRLEDFGLDEAERRAALRPYQQRFGVPDE